MVGLNRHNLHLTSVQYILALRLSVTSHPYARTYLSSSIVGSVTVYECIVVVYNHPHKCFPSIVENVVVMEVVARGRATLQQNGLTTTGLGGGNMVFLPPALFNLPNIPGTSRFSAVSINNRNLLPPRTPNTRLRGNIISANLNVPGGLRNLSNDQRIQLTFNRVCPPHYSVSH